MITENCVSFETAKLLKEKGFNKNTFVNYFVGDYKRSFRFGEEPLARISYIKEM